MSNFSFEGNFKRKPAQNLGGRSRHHETRDMTLIKAQEERQKRENDRAKANAVLVIQAFYRGMRDRRKLNLQLRRDFELDRKESPRNGKHALDKLEKQIARFNYFFKPERDFRHYSELMGDAYTLRVGFKERVVVNEHLVYRIRVFLKKALVGVCSPLPQYREFKLHEKSHMVLMFFTGIQQQDAQIKGVFQAGLAEKINAKIWSYLVLDANCFDKYLNNHFAQFDFKRNPGNPIFKLPGTPDSYCKFYEQFLESMQKISKRPETFRLGRMVYTGKELVQLLLLTFAGALSNRVLPRKGSTENLQILENYVYPAVVRVLLEKDNDDGTCLWSEEWLDVVNRLKTNYSCSTNGIESSIKLRPVMYSFLVMIRISQQWKTNQTEVLQIINSLMPSVDNRKNLFLKRRQGLEMDDEDDEEEDDDPMDVSNYDAEISRDFFSDRERIYRELQIVLNKMELHHWMEDFSVTKWNILYPILSSVIEQQRILATMHFRFLPVLFNKTNFMRSLCLHIMNQYDRNTEELVVFCWLFNQLMLILHDAEFSEGIPLLRAEFDAFIRLLQETISSIILGDKDILDKLEDYYKKEIAQTLMTIHDRNTRINLVSEDSFLSPKFAVVFPVENHNVKFRDFTKEVGHLHQEGLSLIDQRLLRVLIDFPFGLNFHDRVSVWQQMLHTDHLERHISDSPLGREHIQIRRSFIYEDAFDKLSYENVPDLRADVRISLVNVVGVQEAGVDGGGLLREFLTEATKAGVNPNRGLFKVDSENRIYPSPVAKKLFTNYLQHFFLMGRLVGMALYRQILLELPLASFFLQYCAFGSVSSAVDYLAILDPDVHKNLLTLRSYKGDWSELGLDFTTTSEELGETKVIELKPDGRNISVDQNNVIEYIHLVAHFKINRQIAQECRAFRSGLHDVVPILQMFSWREMQTLISGSDKPIDVEDWKVNTNYGGGYSDTHNTIIMFWEVVAHFDEEHLRKLLKFVTSCSRPPLLGFKDLVPKFGISSAGVTDRLPTAATCMNLLKLPEFVDIETLRERLVYAINAQAGFELS